MNNIDQNMQILYIFMFEMVPNALLLSLVTQVSKNSAFEFLIIVSHFILILTADELFYTLSLQEPDLVILIQCVPKCQSDY